MTSTLSVPNEDYLERTVEVLKEKGYVRVSDIAERLSVKPASVTRMLQKLEQGGYITREPYRGFSLTSQGKKVALDIRRRHAILEEFLGMLEVPKKIIDKDIDGLEHHLSNQTVEALERFLKKTKSELKSSNQ
jgi:Mn-dependent DtxR family transcriptional regulator